MDSTSPDITHGRPQWMQGGLLGMLICTERAFLQWIQVEIQGIIELHKTVYSLSAQQA